MEVNLGLVAGSRNSNEFIIINKDGNFTRPEEHELCGQVCQICGDEIGITGDGELFVACNECAFPVCRNCYEYERREGSQVCPQCKTRYKRLKGSARVEGDEEEEDIDDLENEFDYVGAKKEDMQSSTYSQVDDIPEDDQAIVPSSMGNEMIAVQMQMQARPMDPSEDLAAYGYGSVAWKERWKQRQERLRQMRNDNRSDEDKHNFIDDTQLALMDEGRQPLSRKTAIPSSQINPYRIIIIIRVVIVGFFFHYRVTHPVENAYALWLVAVICELCFTLSWILDQFPKWLPVRRETYLDRLSLRYEKDKQPSQLCGIDIFVTTLDPLKESPLVTANTVLSILALDYPPEKVSCYVSDDGAAMLTFEALSETCEFARKWVPFCKKFHIEPRAPEWYFAEKINYLKDKVHPAFVKERRAMKREYEEFRVRINSLVAKARKVPDGGWTMQDGTAWPGNNVRDHPGMIQVFLGQYGGHDVDGNELPRLVYVSREKRPNFKHHKKAGALNALIRVSGLLSNAPYLLNLDYDHYINNSKAIREAMCFMMDPLQGKRVCYVQFSQRFDGVDNSDEYGNQSTAFFDINMKGLDGIQGPIYVGTGCVFKRQTLYGFDAPRKKKTPNRTCNCWPKWCCCKCCFLGRKNKKTKKSKFDLKDSSHRRVHAKASVAECALKCIEQGTKGVEEQVLVPTLEAKLWKKFGQSPVFIASTQLEDGETVEDASLASLLKEAIHAISCGYEDKTEWGKEVGWMYGSTREDILTGFKMHCHGWRSIYCIPERPAFRACAPTSLSDGLLRVFRWALGSTEILLSKHCPLWYGYGGGLNCFQRLAYANATLYPWTSIPLVAYCTLPAVCLLTGKFIVPEVNNLAGMWFISLFMSIFATSILEMRWSGVTVDEWWRNEQFWVIGGVSSHLFALFLGLFKLITGIEASLIVKSKPRGEYHIDTDFSQLFSLNWTALLIIPSTLLILNLIAIVAGVSYAINSGFESWGPLMGKLLFAFWVIVHLYPFLKGMVGRQNRTPTIVIVWSILLASFFSVLWVKIDPFLPKDTGPVLEECGLDCN